MVTSDSKGERAPVTKKVLIIEDDPSIAKLLVLHLKDIGYEPEVANDGIAGAERGVSEKYALIILDLMLSKVS